jgi:GT2 family glycosyltransferase
MPVYNAAATLAECLTRLFHSTFTDFEVVVVDDSSNDQSMAIAANFPVQVVPSGGRVGPAAARNIGARAARGEILFFIDSDVMLGSDVVGRLVERFARGDVDGVVGVQAADMRHRNLASQYKNLWMRWTYSRQKGDVPLFYTTAAAIRRDAFLRTGGFDEGYGGPSIEDQAYGEKLAALGMRVRVQPDLEVEHVKRYTLWGLLKTDFARAVSLTRLRLRDLGDQGNATEHKGTVPATYIASIPVAVVGALALVLGAVLGWPTLTLLGGAASVGALALNTNFLTVIRRNEGTGRAAAAVLLLWLELLVSGAGMITGCLTYGFGRRY